MKKNFKGLVQPGPSLVRRRPREGTRTLTLTHRDPHADTGTLTRTPVRQREGPRWTRTLN